MSRSAVSSVLFALAVSAAVLGACSDDGGDRASDAPVPDLEVGGGQDTGAEDAATDLADAQPAVGDVEDDPDDVDQDPDATPSPPPPTYCAGETCSAGPEQAPDPGAYGPFPVGVTTEILTYETDEGEERLLKVEIWYPGRPGTGEPERYAYDVRADAPLAMLEVIGDAEIPLIVVDAFADMEVFTEYGPYPLVVFSHGAYGIRFQSVFFTIALASHGYIVVAPDHTPNTLYDLVVDGSSDDVLFASAFQRQEDAAFLLDTFIARTELVEDPFFGAIDAEHIGFAGHSFGGLIALYEGWADDRVDAVVPFSPNTSLLAVVDVDVRDYPTPFMMHGGLLDTILDYETEMRAFYDRAPPPRILVELTRGGHYTYTDICQLDLATLAEEIGYTDSVRPLEDGCHPDFIPYAEAHPIINQYSIGFLNALLRDSPGSDVYFSEEAAIPFGEELRVEVDLGE